MPFVRTLFAFTAFALLILGQPVAAQEMASGSYRWLEEGPFAGPLYMVINVDKQMVHVYDGERLVGMASVSTGMRGHRTPTGEFAILQKQQWHRSNIYSNAPMPFMQRLTWDGIALHAGHNPGYPASHGCIRLPYAFARRLFALTQVGTLVNVTQDRIGPVLMVDALVLGDPGSEAVTFALGAGAAAPAPDAPLLEIDPGIFALRLWRH